MSSKKEYRLEIWRCAPPDLDHPSPDRHVWATRILNSVDFEIEKGQHFRKTAMILAEHYDPDVKWHDWKQGKHPTLRLDCWIRQVALNMKNCIEFITVYRIYPFCYKPEGDTDE